MLTPITLSSEYKTPSQNIYCWRKIPGKSFFYYIAILKNMCFSRYYISRGEYTAQKWHDLSLDMLNTIEHFGGDFEITGLNNLQQIKSPVIFVGNHMSTLETFVFPSLIVPYTNLSFVIKEDLLKIPLFGSIVGNTYPITVSRHNSRSDLQRVFSEGLDRISKGRSICIFPQGTREPIFHAKKFNSLGSKLAAKAKVPIIPFAIKTDFWAQGHLIKDFGLIYPKRPIKIAFGEPLPADMDSKASQKACLEFIIEHLRQWEVPCVDSE